MIGDHHGRTAGRATLLVRAVDEILGTHRLTAIPARPATPTHNWAVTWALAADQHRSRSVIWPWQLRCARIAACDRDLQGHQACVRAASWAVSARRTAWTCLRRRHCRETRDWRRPIKPLVPRRAWGWSVAELLMPIGWAALAGEVE